MAAKEKQRLSWLAGFAAIVLLAIGSWTPAFASTSQAPLSENSHQGIFAKIDDLASGASRANSNTSTDFRPGLRRDRIGFAPCPKGVSATRAAASGDDLASRGYRRTGGDRPGSLPVFNKVCFVAGTLVHTSEGGKPIEEIEVGDEVLSYNEMTGQTEYKPVLATFSHEAKEVLDVSIEGEPELLGVTPQHPFFVHRARDNTSDGDSDDKDAGEWIAAGKLREGDRVLRPNGEWVRVVRIEKRATGEQVHNFSVADNHTYFVGHIGTLVHNDCPPDVALGKGKYLYDFADDLNAKQYRGWFGSGLADRPVADPNFAFPFYRATTRAGRIKFNLEDVDIDAARSLDPKLARSVNPVLHPEIGGRDLITEWELRQILQNRRLFEKTDFYYGSRTKFTPEEAASMGLTLMK